MTELEIQIDKMEKFVLDNKLGIHPKRIIIGGIPYMAEIFLLNHHCPCKIDRLECPCKEALDEIDNYGFCECRLFIRLTTRQDINK